MTEARGRFSGKIVLFVIIGIIILIAAIVISFHNRLVRADERINEQWAQVQTQYQRRADLIPNLVETVRGFASHEESLLKEITAMRGQYGQAGTPADYEKVDADFTRAINVVVEAYPELRSNENFLALQAELAGTENRIAVARRDFNTAVASYNRLVRTFPGNIFAAMFGFETREMFSAAPNADTVPTIQF